MAWGKYIRIGGKYKRQDRGCKYRHYGSVAKTGTRTLCQRQTSGHKTKTVIRTRDKNIHQDIRQEMGHRKTLGLSAFLNVRTYKRN